MNGIVRKLIAGSLALVYASTSLASADDGKKPDQQMMEDFAHIVIESPKTPEFLLFLAATMGASQEAIKAVAEDIKKKAPPGRFLPKMALSEDKLLIEGQDVGIRIESLSPVKIRTSRKVPAKTFSSRNKGKKTPDDVWTYDPATSFDKNYFALVEFITPNQSAKKVSYSTLLWEPAHAGVLGGALIGGLVGAGLGLGVSGLFGTSTGSSVLLGAAAGAVVGAGIGYYNSQPAPQPAAMMMMPQQPMVPVQPMGMMQPMYFPPYQAVAPCDAGAPMLVTFRKGYAVSQVIVENTAVGMTVRPAEGGPPMPINALPRRAAARMYRAVSQCVKPVQATMVMGQWNMAQNTMGAVYGVPTGAPTYYAPMPATFVR